MTRPVIVVADVNRAWADTVADVLIAKGYAVHKAFDGEQAFELLSSTAAQLVVLDVHLPRISGFQVLRDFRRLDKSTPILAVSSDDRASVRERAMSDGASAFLRKPMSAAILLRAVRRLLGHDHRGNSTASGANFTVPVA